jgi:uncharacterized membrane protein
VLSIYSFLVLVHVLSAIIGVGATFVFPVLAVSAKNLPQLQFTLNLQKKMNLYPKVGGIFLLLSGLILGFMNPDYFQEIWYTGSLALYIIIEILIIGIVDRKFRTVLPKVIEAKGEEIPDEYNEFAKSTGPIHLVVHIMAIIIIVLMSVKPF